MINHTKPYICKKELRRMPARRVYFCATCRFFLTLKRGVVCEFCKRTKVPF